MFVHSFPDLTLWSKNVTFQIIMGKNQNTSGISTMHCTMFVPKFLGLPKQLHFKMIQPFDG
jgi:hypothetical protein